MFGVLFIVAVLQMALLPGLLVLHLIRANKLTPLVKYTLATMLSIGVNYGLCLTLIVLNLFTQSVVLTIVALECAVLATIYYKTNYPKTSQNNYIIMKTGSDVAYKLFYMLAIAVISWLLIKLFLDPSKYAYHHRYEASTSYLSNYIFMGSDDIASWGSWATRLFNSSIPPSTAGGYPIAMPAWWAVGYKIIDYPLETLPKLISGVWLPLTLPLLLIEHGYLKRQLRLIFSGVIIAILFFVKSKAIFIGLADLPLTTIGFVSLYLLVESAKTSNKSLLIVATLLSLTAPVIKANGFFIVIAFIVGFYLLYPLTIKNKLKYSLFYLMGLIILVMPWYGWWAYNMSIGKTFSNFSYVTETIYGGKSELERFINGLKQLLSTSHWFGWLILLSFFAKDRSSRFLAYFGLAYLAYWACYISYNLRNGLLAWPFLVISGMIVLEYLIKSIYACYKEPILFEQLWQKYTIKVKIYTRILIVIAIIVFISLCLLYPKERVINKFDLLLLERGGKVTKKLDLIFKDDPTPKNIFTISSFIRYRGSHSVWSKYLTYFHKEGNSYLRDFDNIDYILWINSQPSYWTDLIKTEVIATEKDLTLYKVIH